MKTINQLINRAGSLSLKYKDDDLIGMTVGEFASLTRKITELRSQLQAAERSILNHKHIADSIYANAMLESMNHRFEERV